jgi:hypothetical protein
LTPLLYTAFLTGPLRFHHLCLNSEMVRIGTSTNGLDNGTEAMTFRALVRNAVSTKSSKKGYCGGSENTSSNVEKIDSYQMNVVN